MTSLDLDDVPDYVMRRALVGGVWWVTWQVEYWWVTVGKCHDWA